MIRTIAITLIATTIMAPAVAAHAAPFARGIADATTHSGPTRVVRVGMSSAERWHKLFRRHTYMGQRFPYHLRGRFAGDPNIPVRDHRTTVGKVYQCTFMDDGAGAIIVCD